jgi:hypothetical protein
MKALLRGGPSDGDDREVDDDLPSTIGSPSEGGVYERTGETDDHRPVYRWRALFDGEAGDR